MELLIEARAKTWVEDNFFNKAIWLFSRLKLSAQRR